MQNFFESNLIKAAELGEEPEEEEFDVDALIQEEFADQLQDEEEFEDPQEDEVRDNMIGDLRNHFESQTNTIESAKVIPSIIFDFDY